MPAPEPHASPTAPRDRDWKWDGTDKLDRIIEHGGWQAVTSGGRGGADLPQEDIAAVHEHLARHYEEFDEEPPELDR